MGIDEAQFFDEDLPDVCEELCVRGIKVLVAGLPLDFRGEPFGPMGKLMQIADDIHRCHAYCAVCGEKASRTQRVVVHGDKRVPANYNDPVVLVGGIDDYEARCRQHHEVPGKPERKMND